MKKSSLKTALYVGANKLISLNLLFTCIYWYGI